MLLAAAVLLLALGAACSDGTYPVDFFYEMHYQDSYGPNEPPRLSPPEGSVAWFDPPAPIRNGAQLFAINCSVCHGTEGQGDGAVLRIMESKYGYRPALTPDLTSDFVQTQGDEALQGIITAGLVVMPSFRKLLSEEEILLVVDHVRTLSDGDVIIDGPQPVFIAKGCGACHTIEGLEGAIGAIGPALTHVAGRATEEYIRQSIEDPGAVVAEECPTGPCQVPTLMPLNIRDSMTDQEFEDLMAFLLTLE